MADECETREMCVCNLAADLRLHNEDSFREIATYTCARIYVTFIVLFGLSFCVVNSGANEVAEKSQERILIIYLYDLIFITFFTI